MPKLGQSPGKSTKHSQPSSCQLNPPQLMWSRETDRSQLPSSRPCPVDLSKRAPQLGQAGIWGYAIYIRYQNEN